MDWIKWRRDEDERLKEKGIIEEFRKRHGIEGRSALSFWLSIFSILLSIVVAALWSIMNGSVIVDLYRHDPSAWPNAIKGMKYALIFSLPAAILFTIKILRKK